MTLSCRRCSSQTLLHVAIGTALVAVHVFQSCVLNYYIISPHKTSLRAYLWFLADFVVMFVLIGSLIVAHYYLRAKNSSTAAGRRLHFAFSPKRLTRRWSRSRLGVLPLSYGAWLVYAVLVIGKLVVIFNSQVPNQLAPTDQWGPQLLKIGIAASGAVFMLLVEGHHDAEPSSPRNAYIRLLCGSTAYEIMDSVQFLSLLIVRESHMMSSFHMQQAVLALVAVNFLLPTITLYKLSLSDFSLEQGSPYVMACYKLLHLLLVNMSYMVVRLYVWTTLRGDISLFLMKNILGVITTLYMLYPDLVRLCGSVYQTARGSSSGDGRAAACPLPEGGCAMEGGADIDIELDDVMTVSVPLDQHAAECEGERRRDEVASKTARCV